jgi:hypothetical protein
MAMTAAAIVTARILMPEFFCIDLNNSPNFSSISLLNLDLWPQFGFDVSQSSKSPASRGGMLTPTQLTACSQTCFQDKTTGPLLFFY